VITDDWMVAGDGSVLAVAVLDAGMVAVEPLTNDSTVPDETVVAGDGAGRDVLPHATKDKTATTIPARWADARTCSRGGSMLREVCSTSAIVTCSGVTRNYVPTSQATVHDLADARTDAEIATAAS
jgi:hypothetical protein